MTTEPAPIGLPPEILAQIQAGMPPDLIILTREHVAAMLHVHPTSIGKMVSRGKLRTFKTGPEDGLPRFLLSDVAAYIAHQRENGGSVVRKLEPNPHRLRKQMRAVAPEGEREPWDAA